MSKRLPVNSKESPLQTFKFEALLIKHAGITGSTLLIGQGANYGMVFLLTYKLGAGGFGLFSLALMVMNIATLIGSLSLGVTILRFAANYKGKEDTQAVQTLIGTILIVVLAWSLLIAGLIELLAPLLAEQVFRKPELTSLFRIIAWAIPLSALFRIFVSGLHGLGLTDVRAYLEQLVLPFTRLALVAVSLFVSSNVTSALWAMVIASSIATVIAGIQLAHKSRFWIIKWHYILNEWGAWAKYTAPTFLDALLVTSMGGSLEVLLLGIFGTRELVGIYSVVLKFKAILNMPMVALNNALAPVISKLHTRGELEYLQHIFKDATRWVAIAALPLGAIYILFGDVLLGLFGDTFTRGYVALVIVTLGQFVNIAVGPVGHILLMTGYSRIRLVNSLILLAIQLILGLWLIPIWQLTGTSLVAAVSIATISILGLIQVFVLLKIHPYRLVSFKPWLACFVAMSSVVGIRVMSEVTVLWFITILILGFGVMYLVVLWSLGLNSSDQAMLSRIIPMKFKKSFK